MLFSQLPGSIVFEQESQHYTTPLAWDSESFKPIVGAQNTGYLFNGYADLLGVDHGSLLAVDGGGTSLTTRLRFVDLSGLADRRIAQLWDDDDMPGLRDHVFDDVRPTFIKIYDGWAGRNRLALAQDERLARDYVLLRSGHRRREWVRRDAVPNNDAFAAGYAACFQNAMLGIARREHLSAEDSIVTARVGIGQIGNGRLGLEVELIIKLPSVPDRARAEDLVAKAHERCPYSNATRGNIQVTLTLL